MKAIWTYSKTGSAMRAVLVLSLMTSLSAAPAAAAGLPSRAISPPIVQAAAPAPKLVAPVAPAPLAPRAPAPVVPIAPSRTVSAPAGAAPPPEAVIVPLTQRAGVVVAVTREVPPGSPAPDAAQLVAEGAAAREAWASFEAETPGATLEQRVKALEAASPPQAEPVERVEAARALAAPDLVITDVARIGAEDHPSAVHYRVSNDWIGDAGRFEVHLYLSEDPQIDSRDLPVAIDTVGALVAGATHEAEIPFELPPGVAPGDYYLGAIVDPGDQLLEQNPTDSADRNNAWAGDFVRVAAASDDTASAADKARAGDSVPVAAASDDTVLVAAASDDTASAVDPRSGATGKLDLDTRGFADATPAELIEHFGIPPVAFTGNVDAPTIIAGVEALHGLDLDTSLPGSWGVDRLGNVTGDPLAEAIRTNHKLPKGVLPGASAERLNDLVGRILQLGGDPANPEDWGTAQALPAAPTDQQVADAVDKMDGGTPDGAPGPSSGSSTGGGAPGASDPGSTSDTWTADISNSTTNSDGSYSYDWTVHSPDGTSSSGSTPCSGGSCTDYDSSGNPIQTYPDNKGTAPEDGSHDFSPELAGAAINPNQPGDGSTGDGSSSGNGDGSTGGAGGVGSADAPPGNQCDGDSCGPDPAGSGEYCPADDMSCGRTSSPGWALSEEGQSAAAALACAATATVGGSHDETGGCRAFDPSAVEAPEDRLAPYTNPDDNSPNSIGGGVGTSAPRVSVLDSLVDPILNQRSGPNPLKEAIGEPPGNGVGPSAGGPG